MKKYNLLLIAILFCCQAYSQARTETFQLRLGNDWKMQSAVTEPAPAVSISKPQFDTKGWYSVNVPTTIIGGLLANKVYNFDPFYGRNLEKLADARLDKPWWFRREFILPASESGKEVILVLHGINYKANIWLNGIKLADSTQTKGPFRIIKLNVTKQINYKSANVLALEITRPFNPNKSTGDLAIDYADWIHYPPDYNGGIVNDVDIKTYDKVGVDHPLVATNFDLPSLKVAHLFITAEVSNYTNTPQDAVVKGHINGNISFEKKIHLDARETRHINFGASEFPQLDIKDPRIWWPYQYGKPELNRIELSAVVAGKKSNTLSENFGIRQITSELINNKSRMFIVNGKRIMLRGAAWSPDIFQRRSEERQEQEVQLVRDMNMNIIRSEGKFEDDHFYDLCDKYGMLVMTGFMCCGSWQHPEHWDKDERKLAMASDSSLMYWLRNKASILSWLNGSDMPPTDTTVERGFLNIEQDLKFPNPILATADGRKSKVSGFSGVKMLGPYEWVPPVYWENDATKEYGGAWSFATEISPGPSIPPYESLIKFIPRDSLTTTSADWLYHCGTQSFGTTKIFNKALDSRYGVAVGIKNYAAKAQAQNYEAHRAMMEAYGLYKYNTATGVVQWMLSNPWPSLIWHTYDYYLYPAGTYFGMKKSMEPLHVMYSYKSNEVAIINSYLQKFEGLKVTAAIYNLDGSLKYTKTLNTSIDADASKTCFALPAIAGLSDTYFVRLQLSGANGVVHSINWYWLAKKGDELNWKKSNWFTTPQSAYADYSALQNMPKASLKVNHTQIAKGDSTLHTVTISNNGKSVAFFVHLRALKGKGGDDILPVIFSDNYISLAPGESRVIKCTYKTTEAKGTTPYLLTSAWNLDLAKSSGSTNEGFETGLPVN
ncbi:MAG: glycoside hydrolase family 2 protein [Bacteroidota bacterium]